VCVSVAASDGDFSRSAVEKAERRGYRGISGVSPDTILTDSTPQKLQHYLAENLTNPLCSVQSHDGAIDENEFRIAVRKLLKVPPLVLSDKDLKAFFGELSGRVEMNSDNSLDKDAFVKFIAGAAEEDGGGPGNGNGEWNGYVDEEAILKENVKRIKFKINSQVGKLAGIGGKDLRDVFFSMDVDGSGTISLNELCKGLRTVLKISEREIGRNDVLGVFKALDRNGDGVLSLEEFMEFLEKKEM